MRKEIEEQLEQVGEAIIAATVPISAMEATSLMSKLKSQGKSLVIGFRASDHSVHLQLRGQIAFVDKESLGLTTGHEKGSYCIVSLQDCTFRYRDEASTPKILRTEKYEGSLLIFLPSEERISLRILRPGEAR
jgi:formamidopyrimidine-DNA glycosylase